MAGNIRGHIAGLLRTSKRHSRYVGVLALLAVVVALGVTMGLRRNGRAATVTETVLDCHAAAGVAHTHNADCYDGGDLVCPLQERELHVHDDSCYDEEGNLVCGKEEAAEQHVHGAGCFKTVTKTVADDEVVEEKPAEAEDKAEIEMPAQSFTGKANGAKVTVEAPEGAFPAGTTMKVAAAERAAEKAAESAVAETLGGEGEIKKVIAVDITFSDKDGNEIQPQVPIKVSIVNDEIAKAHEPVVVHVSDGDAKVVEQNASAKDEVAFSADSFSVYAVVIIDKDADTLEFETDKYLITVSYTKEAEIPYGTELEVKEIEGGSAEYDKLWNKTLAKINEGVKWENKDTPDPRKNLADAAFFDITLSYEGKEIEPKVPLKVSIEYKDGGILLPKDEKAGVVHFGDKGIELINDVLIEKTAIDDSTVPSDLSGSHEVSSFTCELDGLSPVGTFTTGESGEGVVSGPMRLLAAPATRASEISASKTITDTDGDGVYELALSVTGASESSSETKVDKSNVVIVIDTSGSMQNNYVYTPYTYSADTYSSDTTYYRNTNGNRVWYWPGGNYYNQYHAAGWYRGSYGQFNTSHSGAVYTRQTRMEATKDAAVALVDALLANNKNETTEDGTNLNDIIEISLVTFAGATNNNTNGYLRTYNNTHFSGTSDSASATTLKNYINNLTAVGGTNWEQALKAAKTSADTYSSQTGESTSIIFLTDGKPTFHGSNDSGDGQEGNTNVQTCWTEASDDARAIVTAGYTLYDIFAFGTDTGTNSGSNFLKALTNYAYTGTGTYSNYATTQYTRDYFFDATDTQALTDAFQKIIDNIKNTVGYGGVEYDDGVTLGVTNTSVAIDGQTHEDSFRYTVRSGNNIVYTVKIANGTATFSINGETYTDDSAEQVVTKPDPNDESTWITSDVYSVVVGGKTYAMSPAAIDPETGMIEWDLAGLGILENGYTYTLAFDVWPNQYSYDLVADLNNGVKTLAQVKADVIAAKTAEGMTQAEAEAFWKRIEDALVGPDASGQYAVKTNYQQSVDYYTVETEEDGQGGSTTTYSEKQTKNVTFDGEIALTSKPLPMNKVWSSNLSPEQLGSLLYEDYPTNQVPTKYRVTLHLWKADTPTELESLIDQYAGDPAQASAHDYIEKTLGWNEAANDYDWDDSVAIAPGTMVSLSTAQDMGIPIEQSNIVTYDGAQYYIIEHGHYYYVTEDNVDWHFELETVVYHPMMVNGRLKNVTFTYDADGNVTGVEDIEDMTQVTATNSKTAELDITKKIVDNTGNMTQAQKDAETFTYKVTLTVPADADMSHTNALEWVARYNDDASASNRYYVYGYQTNEDEEVLGLDDDVQRFNGRVYGQYTVSYPGGGATLDEIFTTDADGETQSGTIYVTLKQNEIIRFTNLPSGTQYRIEEMYNNLYQADPSRDADANLGESAPASNIEANGYTVTVATKNGSPSVSGRVVTGTINELNRRYYNQFTNTLNQPVADIEVIKHLDGYEWTGERYYMKLGGTPLPRTTQRYLSAASGTDDVSYNFGNVHFGEAGTYSITVTETGDDWTTVLSGDTHDVNGKPIVYDDVKTVEVTVAEVDGVLQITDVKGSDGVSFADNTISVTVTNKYVTADIDIKKVGEDDSVPLTGAKFKLYSDAELKNLITEDAAGNPIGSAGEITVDDEAGVDLGTLEQGTYYLVETQAPAGYNKLKDPVVVVVSDIDVTADGRSAKVEGEDGSISYVIVVNNTAGTELPMTGGPGTALFNILGSAIATAAVLTYLLLSRRTSEGRSWV